MAIIKGSTPKQDGFRMPGEFEEQDGVFMLWPYRPDCWRDNALPAKKAFADVALAISEFEPVMVLAKEELIEEACNIISEKGGARGYAISVAPCKSNDAWVRDCGPTFVIDDSGNVRACDWEFNAWGGDFDGLYSPWDDDNAVPEYLCDALDIDRYKPEGFVLEGGSIHSDGEGTILTTEMCLLSPGRNPHLTKEEIEETLKEYLGAEKVLWIPRGIDPEETTGHVDDVACFIAPGEVACIWSDNPEDPFYEVANETYDFLKNCTDAKGRQLKVHRVPTPIDPVTIGKFNYEENEDNKAREEGELCIASYMNFLIVNGGVIVPQYGDKCDALALRMIRKMFPDRRVVGVDTREIVYGGGNIHCITQHQPAPHFPEEE